MSVKPIFLNSVSAGDLIKGNIVGTSGHDSETLCRYPQPVSMELKYSSAKDLLHFKRQQNEPFFAQTGKFLPPLAFLKRSRLAYEVAASTQTRVSRERGPLQKSLAQHQSEGLKLIGE